MGFDNSSLDSLDNQLPYNNLTIDQLMSELRLLEYLNTFQEVSRVSELVAKIVIPIFLVIGVVGNILVIYISASTERIINHPIQSMLVVNLAIADTIYLLSSAPYQISAFSSSGWIYGGFLCPALHFLNLLTMSVSIFTMCTMALIRLVSLIRPFEHHTGFFTHSTKVARSLIIFLIWAAAVGLSSPAAIFYRLEAIRFKGNSSFVENYPDIKNCLWTGGTFSQSVYIISVLVSTYLAPCFLVTIVYLVIGKKLVGFMPRNRDSMQNQERTDYRKTTKLILILVIAFFICWLPYNLYIFLYEILKIDHIDHGVAKHVLNLLGYCFSYAHACINPIIYTFGLSSFQRNLKKTIHVPLWMSKVRRWHVFGASQRRSSLSSLFHQRKTSLVVDATLLSPLTSSKTPIEEKSFFVTHQCSSQSNNSSNHLSVAVQKLNFSTK